MSKNSLNGKKIRRIERDRKEDVIGLGRHFSAISAVALLVDIDEVRLIFRHSTTQHLNSPNDKIFISVRYLNSFLKLYSHLFSHCSSENFIIKAVNYRNYKRMNKAIEHSDFCMISHGLASFLFY